MSKIIYLMGAGASAGALPVVTEIPSRLNEVRKSINANYKLSSEDSDTQGILGFTKTMAKDKLLEDLDWLRIQSLQHSSVDTLAKKAYLKSEVDTLKKIKAGITALFYILQVTQRPDIRYDTFLASVLDKSLKIPSDIKVVSWNYDFQFEKAYSSYIDDMNLGMLESKLGVISKFSREGFGSASIFKINGNTDVSINQDMSVTSKLSGWVHREDMPKFYEDFCNSYYHSFYVERNSESLLSFAWENSKMIDKVKEVIHNATVLVVIGYSFPFFNREIDRSLLSDLDLMKIYIQDKNPDNIWSRMKSILVEHKEVDCELISSTDQFYLPSEL